MEITNKRDDGYHDIESIFQKINLYDELYIEKLFGHSGIEIKSNNRSLENSKNIIYKAYYRLKMEFPQITRVKVILKKNIPMQAGLGGGSSDCATFIEGINKLFNLKLTKEKMKKIGKELGADIPSMFHEKPLIARGIGEIIEEINDTIKYYLIVIKPNFSCSTKEMYKKIDKKMENKKEIETKNNMQEIKKGIINKNIKKISENLYNVFEKNVGNLKEIMKIKKELLGLGANGALMTGSGSCIYGIFENKNQAKNAYKKMQEKYEIYYTISK
ncbi:MAG: 4-(cytidine 5'-diphospho)-2-C-methyl-D-erythritol kinase [Clostridia bacterium]|nr:4-(cytidine 5'-diphospho)-2-C-methyl-D-erythritol kinase [Clostridia bacterium]